MPNSLTALEVLQVWVAGQPADPKQATPRGGQLVTLAHTEDGGLVEEFTLSPAAERELRRAGVLRRP